jgi:hypothetical protein
MGRGAYESVIPQGIGKPLTYPDEASNDKAVLPVAKAQH